MLIETRAGNAKKLLAVNDASLTFASKISTLTEPTGLNVVDCRRGGAVSPNVVSINPFGAGADGTTFSIRLLKWTFSGDGPTRTWHPQILAELACTLSAAVGVAGGDVIDTDRFADTLTLVTNMGNANVDITITSVQNDTMATAIIDLKGPTKIEFVFDMTGATNGNVLFQML